MRRPKIPLTPDEQAVIRRWSRCILGAWVVVVVATLSLSMFGPDRVWRTRLPVAECSEMVCLQVIQTGARRQ
jgi:hypothetical protein